MNTMSRRRPPQDDIFLGTPVDADGEFVPEWKQDARDERGRKRFHGAFTGGFSAGYFNTVGSKEGWTPRTFKSSRTARAEPARITAEEIMDDEDVADMRAAERVELVKVGVSVGREILNKLGWKTGFGVGKLVETEVAGRKVMMPPRDVSVRFENKENSHGLGYDSVIVRPKKKPKVVVSSDEEEYEIRPLAAIKKKTSASTIKKLRMCHDGRMPLAGFVLVPEPANPYKPVVPDDYKPGLAVPTEPSEQPQKESKSVFDFMTPAQREKLVSLTGNAKVPAAKSEPGMLSLVPVLAKAQAETVLRAGFVPYSDPGRARRYTAYLETQAGQRDVADLLASDAPDLIAELREFRDAAAMFRPLKGALANRFTVSVSSANAKTSVVEDDARERQPQERPDSQAARMGMYGPLTRAVRPWMPAKLLSKRFGVRPPDMEATSVDAPEIRRELLSTDTMVQIAKDANVDVELKSNVNAAFERPMASQDLFLAVFGEDDSTT